MNRFIPPHCFCYSCSLVACGGSSNSENHQSVNPPVAAVPGKFAFVRQLPNGENPRSVTPMIGSFGKDGAFVATNINDPVTGKPSDMTIASAFLSSDATKIV